MDDKPNSSMPTVIILSAGCTAVDMTSLFGEIPSGMIPLKQKPALRWIIDDLCKNHFNDFIISVGFKKELVTNYINNLQLPNCTVRCVEVDYKKSPGSSIQQLINNISNPNGVLVVLGDTIMFEKIDVSSDHVFTSIDFLYPDQFSSVIKDQDGFIKTLSEKNITKTAEDEALIGVYFFKDCELLKNVCSEINSSSIQISQILEKYNAKRKMKVLRSVTWLDLGHLDKYYHAKVALSQSRFFNSLEYDSLFGIITKRSQNKEKFRDEILWYQNLPSTLVPLAPRIFEYSIDDNPFVKMEYYSYPTLSELFIYGQHSIRLWEQIFSRLFKLTALFLEQKHFVSEIDFDDMYIEKTFSRVKQACEQNDNLYKLLNADNVIVNGQNLLGLPALNKFITERCYKLKKEKDIYSCLIHGDLCFSNILFDVSSGIFRFLDPRGRWGQTAYGDFRYDLAKLRHSISGRYDFIVNDLFSVQQSDNKLTVKIYDSKNHSEISDIFDQYLKKNYNLQDIIFIEGLLFISMIPLHKDNNNRQLAMLSRGLQLLNQCYIKSSEV